MPRLKDWIAQANEAVQTPAAGLSELSVEAQSTTVVQQADPELQQQVTQLQKAYAGRVAAHGQRLFRHPDGKLYDKPTASPHAMATRRKWSQVVQHCRVTGGDAEYSRTGKSWRYGNGVLSKDHAVLLASIGLLPEDVQTGDTEQEQVH